MGQDNSNNSSLRILVSDILNIQKDNKIIRAMYTKARQDADMNFATKKIQYSEMLNNKDVPYIIKQKYNLEYVFLFEQYNLKVIPLENNLRRIDLFENRLDSVLKYINIKNNPNKSISNEKALEYAINNAVTAEAINYYDSAIEEARQYRIVYSKFKFYVDYLEKNHDPDYQKYVTILPQQDELDMNDEEIDQLQFEKATLIDILRTEKFTMQNVRMPDLTGDDVNALITLMYPKFKEKLDENFRKGKQVA